MCDDLGWGDVGYHGHPSIQTPHIDAMAREGVRLERFYSAAPVCSPTRGSCLTGRHPYRYGITFANTEHLPEEELTLAEILRAEGYATGHFGKWHLGTLTTEVKDSNRGGPEHAAHYSPPWEHGFDVCFSSEARIPTYDPMVQPEGGATKPWWDALSEPEAAEAFGTYYWNERGEMVLDDGSGSLLGDDSRIIVDRAIPFLEAAAERGQPSFTIIWLHAPHRPVVAGPDHVAPYPEASGYERNYWGCITALDEQLGRVRATLRELGIEENTLLAFCSDNGPEGSAQDSPGIAKPFRGRKRSLYEGGIRGPALIEFPARLRPGLVFDFPMSTSDYLPTVLDAVGIGPPSGLELDGISLWPVFRGEVQERSKPIGFQSHGQAAWTTHRHKIYRKKPEDPWQLYDLLDDPFEATDLANSMPERVAELAQDFEVWRLACEADWEAYRASR